MQKKFFQSWAAFLIRSDAFIILFVAFSLLIPIAVLTGKLSFRLDTDYNVLLPMAQYAIWAVTNPQHFLTWNPYIGLGIPVLGDPSSFVLSPWYMPVFLLFGADMGIRFIIALTVIVSGMTMRRLLSSIHIKSEVIIWGSVLYQFSGAIAALIASGHFERFASYAVTPLVIFYMWQNPLVMIQRITLGMLFAGMYLSNDMYSLWFLGIFWVGFSGYYLLTKRKTWRQMYMETTVTLLTTLVFSMPKLIFFIRDILPHFSRAYINPYEGSIHAFLLPLVYIIPWQVAFYDRPSLQRLLGFHYNWYEYYAFISPIAFFVLGSIKRIIKRSEIQLSIVAICIASLYISVDYWYSPFHWIFRIFPIARTFRVPQRIGVPLLVPILVIVASCADFWITKASRRIKMYIFLICVVSSIWVGSVFFQTVLHAFEPSRKIEAAVARELRIKDAGAYYVVNFSCCIQPFLLKHAIPVLNYYYGWTPTYGPKFTNASGDAYDFSQFFVWRPSYIIAPKAMKFSSYGYYPYFTNADIYVWKTEYPNIFPSL